MNDPAITETRISTNELVRPQVSTRSTRMQRSLIGQRLSQSLVVIATKFDRRAIADYPGRCLLRDSRLDTHLGAIALVTAVRHYESTQWRLPRCKR